MHPVVAPSRSSHTRSVLARLRARFSGYGIFTDVTRLMALRTSSRSAAWPGAATRASSRLARTRDLACWNICEIPPNEPPNFSQASRGPALKQSPRFNTQGSRWFAARAKKCRVLRQGHSTAHNHAANYARATAKNFSFAQVLESDLDAIVVELLIFAAKLIAPIGAAMEELADHPDWGVRLAFEAGRAADVDRAVEVEIVDVVVEVAHHQAGDGLVADAQHLRSGADGGYVLEAPADFVIETQAGNRCPVGVQLHPLGARQVVAQVLRER